MNVLRDHVPAGRGTGCPGYARRFDDWAASYDLSPLQTVLYGPVHDAVLRYAREHVRQPGMILDVGYGTGRLSARLASAYDQARVVGIDASAEMIQNAASTTVPCRSRFAAAMAERLPFADAVFDLVVVTLSLSHWRDRAAGLAQISRVIAPDGTLVAAGTTPVGQPPGWCGAEPRPFGPYRLHDRNRA